MDLTDWARPGRPPNRSKNRAGSNGLFAKRGESIASSHSWTFRWATGLCLTTVALLLLPVSAGAVPLVRASPVGPGEILTTTQPGAVSIVHPLTGTVRVVASIPTASGVVLLPSGALLVSQSSSADLFEVDPMTGTSTLAATIMGASAVLELAIENDDRVLAATPEGLFRLDLSASTQSLLVAPSPLFRPSCFAISSDGTIFASDDGVDGFGAIHRIDPISGAVTQLAAGLDDSGICLTADPNDNLLVTLVVVQELWRVDPIDATTELVTSGDLFDFPYQIAANDSGAIYVANDGNSQRLAIDPVTGAQSVVWTGQGFTTSLAVAPGIAVVPAPIPTLSAFGLLLLISILGALGARSSREPARRRRQTRSTRPSRPGQL